MHAGADTALALTWLSRWETLLEKDPTHVR